MTKAPRIGARDRPDATRERGPADDGGGDDVELIGRPDILSVAPLRRADHDGAGERAQDAHEDVRLHDRPAGVDAREVRRLGVAAVRVHVSTEAPARRDERHDDADRR